MIYKMSTRTLCAEFTDPRPAGGGPKYESSTGVPPGALSYPCACPSGSD